MPWASLIRRKTLCVVRSRSTRRSKTAPSMTTQPSSTSASMMTFMNALAGGSANLAKAQRVAMPPRSDVGRSQSLGTIKTKQRPASASAKHSSASASVPSSAVSTSLQTMTRLRRGAAESADARRAAWLQAPSSSPSSRSAMQSSGDLSCAAATKATFVSPGSAAQRRWTSADTRPRAYSPKPAPTTASLTAQSPARSKKANMSSSGSRQRSAAALAQAASKSAAHFCQASERCFTPWSVSPHTRLSAIRVLGAIP
mmetsp:Transcript_10904/g.36399  ORF Transcript_10904/g.36399 Transcript_10904/m.36399 type:complete len:256 (-) Transcript_10904:36-803(-)